MFSVKSCHCLCSNPVHTTSYCHMDNPSRISLVKFQFLNIPIVLFFVGCGGVFGFLSLLVPVCAGCGWGVFL